MRLLMLFMRSQGSVVYWGASETQQEVVLVPRLRDALRRLNAGVADEAIELANSISCWRTREIKP